MKIIPNYFTNNVSVNNVDKTQVFTSNPQEVKQKKVVASQPRNVELQNITTTQNYYNIKVPMSYKQLDDIKLPNNLTAKCYKLANGQKVVIVPKDGTTVVKTYVNTGSLNEPDNLRGISHYIEHNLFNGSEDLGEKVFFEEVNKMGANTNASTSFASTDYFISSNLLEETDLEESIKLHAGMLQSPKFLADKLEKEKKIVNSEINMYMSEDENIGFTQTLKNLFNIKTTSLDLVAGTTNNITALTRDDVVDYFNKNYYPANMTTVITGEVDPEKTMAIVSKYFNSTKTQPSERYFEKLTPTNKPVRIDLMSKKTQCPASIFLGFAGPENNNIVDKVHLRALNLLACGLQNSRISKVEDHFGISINFGAERLSSNPNDKSMCLISTEVNDISSEHVLQGLYKVIDNLSKNPPSEAELSAIKNIMKKTNEQVFESSHAINYHLGTSFMNGTPNSLQQQNEIIDKMTAQDIINVAKKYYDLNKVSLTVVHPRSSTAESINSWHQIAKHSPNIAFTGTNKKSPINLDKISKFKMNNNFEVVFHDVNSNIVEYDLTISKKNWTAKKAATADILNEMLILTGTSTKSKDEISKIKDIKAIDFGVYANELGIKLNGNFHVDNTKDALELFIDKIQNPDFNQKTFDTALSHWKERYENADISAYSKFNKAIYSGTPNSITIKDKLNSLKDITINDVIELYNNIMNNSQGQITVTGPISKYPELKNEIFNNTAKYRNVLPKNITLPNYYKPVEKIEVHTEEYNKNQAQILQGFKYKQTGNLKDATTIALLNEIIGGSSSSRLFTDLREQRHLAYNVGSNYNNTGDIGVFQLFIKTTTENQETGENSFDNIQKSITGFNENIEKIKTQKVSDEELEAAKKNLKTNILTSLEMNSSKNSVISTNNRNIYGIDFVNKKLEMIDKITADDIKNAANYIFNSKPIYSIAATKASLEANKEFLDSLIK